MYPTQDTLRMGIAMVKQEEEADIRITARVVRNLDERKVVAKGKSPLNEL